MNVFYQIKRTWLVGAVLLSVMLSYSSLGAKEPTTLSEKIDKNFTPFVKTLSAILFLDPFEAIGLHDGYVRDEKGNIVMKDGQPLKVNVPLVVVWLVMGAIYFTLRMRFVNLRGFVHAIELVRGKFRRKDDKGEISSFQALATALSATVGMGNIAGVAVAISVGGEGASFWMIVSAFLGMSSKFVECSLGVKYRQIDKTGMVHGGPMYYLKEGLKQKGLPRLGSFLAILFAVMCVGGSLGGGNMLQANQAFLLLSEQLPSLKSYGFWFGLVFASLVGIVTIGGVKSIARVTDKLVPFMCAFYLIAGFIVIFVHLPDVPAMLWRIVSNAFCPSAMYGGFLGVLIQGFRRASFSNEAGIGSSAIAHAPARTNEPTSEGLVAMLEPVVDTMIVCTMTA
ncbi:MAG: alanine:cation symporter family protein, partial [Flammeovirgaceae bacterium]|nr:alanine:cation symporter family protein [Flammeovirgaceae bacterium]MDW8287782.1 amino acid carrier protein [Flammeovirgaceae bacterium]